MTRLLLLLGCLLPFLGHAASIPFTGARGGGAAIVTTNPSAGTFTVTVDGYAPITSSTTNVVVGNATNQSITMLTSSNQFLNFQGSGNIGEVIEAGISNAATTNIYISFNANGSASSFYDNTAGSNVVRFAVAAGTIRIVTFKWSTAFGAIWRMYGDNGFIPDFKVAGPYMVLLTNTSPPYTIFASNSWNPASAVVTGYGTGNTNYLCVLSSNSANIFFCGSNAVNIIISNPVANGPGFPIPWTVIVTNRTATPYTVSFVEAGAVTNNFLFMGTYGQTRPTVATNGTKWLFAGIANGTNHDVGYASGGIFPP